MISLFPFQIKASEEIFTRYNNYKNSDNRPYETKTKPVPFYQALAAITGAGKTIAPIFLSEWMIDRYSRRFWKW